MSNVYVCVRVYVRACGRIAAVFILYIAYVSYSDFICALILESDGVVCVEDAESDKYRDESLIGRIKQILYLKGRMTATKDL